MFLFLMAWIVWTVGGFIRFITTMDRPNRVLDYQQMRTQYLLIFGLIHGPIVFLLSIGFVLKRWWVENDATVLLANVMHRSNQEPVQTLASQLVQQQAENSVLVERARRLESLMDAIRKEINADKETYQSEELRQLLRARTGPTTPGTSASSLEPMPVAARNIRIT